MGGAEHHDEDRCERLRLSLSLYVDGVSTLEEKQTLEQHMASCADCRNAYEWMVATREVMTRRPAAIPPPEMSQRIRAALAATREEEARQAYRFRTIYRPAYALAASAVLAALLYGGLTHKRAGLGGHPIQVANNGGAPHTDVTPLPPAIDNTPVMVTPPAVHSAPVHNHSANAAPDEATHAGSSASVKHSRPDRDSQADNDDKTPPAPETSPLRLVVPPSAIKTTPKTHVSPVVHHPALVAIKTPPTRHVAPVIVDKPHHDDVVATTNVPDTTATGDPTSPRTTPDTGTLPDTHPGMVASQTDMHTASNAGLLEDVRGYVAIMKTKAPSTGSFRVRNAPEIRNASFNTPTSDGNMGESVSGTASIVTSPYH